MNESVFHRDLTSPRISRSISSSWCSAGVALEEESVEDFTLCWLSLFGDVGELVFFSRNSVWNNITLWFEIFTVFIFVRRKEDLGEILQSMYWLDSIILWGLIQGLADQGLMGGSCRWDRDRLACAAEIMSRSESQLNELCWSFDNWFVTRVS